MKLKPVSAVAVVLAGALALFAVGCGGGGSKSSAQTEAAATTTEATTTAEAATTEESATTTSEETTTSESQSSSGTSFKSTKNCKDLATLGAKLSSALQSSNSANFEDTLTNEQKAFAALADAAPKDIRGDFQTFAKAFGDYVEVVKKVGFKPGKVPTQKQIAELTKAAQGLSSAKLQTAEQHLSAWAQKNCGGIVPTTTGG
jgi:hypothetical protein